MSFSGKQLGPTFGNIISSLVVKDTIKWLLWKSLSRVRLFATSWTVARQAPLSVEFSR